MKMSDVFELPVDVRGRNNLVTDHYDETVAAVHAINNHDKLVEALDLALTSACDNYSCSEEFFDHISEILKQAKEG